MKKVLFVASECVPFMKTGGLADVVGSLPKYINKDEFDVRVMLPKYMAIPDQYKQQMQYKTHFYMDLAWRTQYVGVSELQYNGITFYFIDNEYYFSGFAPYGNIYEDVEKFAFFCKASLSTLPLIGFQPDIIHCHDWQTGLLPVYLKDCFVQNDFFRGIKTVMTIHNLKFQGIWDKNTVADITGLNASYFTPDKLIAYNYNVDNFRKEKIKNKRALQQELGLAVDNKKFMIGIVSRLTDQKGFDLIDYVIEEICAEDTQLVVLGTGTEKYENLFRHYAWKYPDRVSANIYYSNERSHKIYASADAFLMPSLFEPCGLSQLMSLRYGTVPIVRETGGLRDTVAPYNEYEGTGTGFSFRNYNAHEMLNTIRYAKSVYCDKKREWNKIVERAMTADFSWRSSARKYEDLYNRL